MKRTLSLILALAMIMSMVTTVSFAASTVAAGSEVTAVTIDGHPVKYANGKAYLYYLAANKPEYDEGDIDVSGVTYNFKSLNKGGTYDTLTYYSDNEESKYYTIKIYPTLVQYEQKTIGDKKHWTSKDKTYYYTGVADDNSFYAVSKTSGVTITSDISGGKIRVKTIKVGATTETVNYVTEYKLVNNSYYISTPKTLAIPTTKTDYDLSGITGAITSGAVYTAIDGELIDEIKYYAKSGSTKAYFACADASAVDVTSAVAKFATANVPNVYLPLTIDKKGGEVSLSITNGSTGTYTFKKGEALLKAINADGAALNANTQVTVTIPAAGEWGDMVFYKNKVHTDNKLTAGDEFTINSSNNLLVKTKAGTIEEVELEYTAGIYSGTITIKSAYVTPKKEAKQTALFHFEKFFLDSISGIEYLDPDDDASAYSSDAEDDYHKDNTFLVNPSGKSDKWTESYTGYTTGKVAQQVEVTFTPVDYDILTYVEDGKSQFSFEAFELFAENVAEEQLDHYAVSVDHVEFEEVSGTKWKLKKGSSQIKTTDEFTSSTLGSVYLDTTTAGFFDIPVRVYYDYKATKTSNWTTSASNYYRAMVRVYAGTAGDIKYEVGQGDSIAFKTADFSAVYKKLAGSSKKLESVTIDGLPLYGGLYYNNKLTSAYEVKEGGEFLVDPSSANSAYDVNKLVYWASKTSTSDYSVYVPVTMDGTGGTEVAVVEIVVKNLVVPFTDVAKGSTFYDYIKYCYDKGIMGGKSATKFDATSSVTRAQLVTTLYRMAGSPTTHNAKVLPFTDTTGLSTEFSNAVKWAYYNKMVGGTSATTFAPNNAVTRQAMVKILYGYAKAYDMGVGVVYNGHLGSYADGGKVAADMQTAMNWAVDYGLLSGNGNKLNPGGSTTRGAAAKVLANFHASFVG